MLGEERRDKMDVNKMDLMYEREREQTADGTVLCCT